MALPPLSRSSGVQSPQPIAGGAPPREVEILEQPNATREQRLGPGGRSNVRSAASAPVWSMKAPFLPEGRWAQVNHARLEPWLAELALRTARGEKITAAFDWDNTCVFRDVGDAAIRWQAEHLDIRLSPEALAQVLPERVGEVDTVAGVRLADVRADLLEAYAEIRTLGSAARGSTAHQDFRAKLLWLYDALGSDERIGHAFGYQWVTQFFAGMTDREARSLGERVATQASAEALGKITWTAARPGKSGVLSVNLETGMRAQDEVKALFRGLHRAGVDVYVVSASLQPIVQGAARALGYDVESSRIYGMRLAEEKDGRFGRARPDGYYVPYRAGKQELIDAFLPTKPVLVAGDANTDYEMLVAYPETEVRLVFNRNAQGDIRKLYATAEDDRAQKPGKGRTVTLLQGRDENTGLVQADVRTTRAGESAPTSL